MTNQHHERAARVVTAFMDTLDDSVRKQITGSQVNTLTLMIKKALGEELSLAVERVEELLRQLRTETDKPELGI